MKSKDQNRIFNPEGYECFKITFETRHFEVSAVFTGESITEVHEAWKGLLVAAGYSAELIKEFYPEGL